MLTKTIDECLAVESNDSTSLRSASAWLLAKVGCYRKQQLRNNEILNVSHARKPVYEKVPMRVWRRRGAVLMELYGEQDRL